MANPNQQLQAALSDRYAIEREIGAGGMATVFLARDLKHHRSVAVKLLHAELGAIVGAERFLKEIEVTANLQHPNILPLFDSGQVRVDRAGRSEELLYYVMPYVDGESLRTRLKRERQLGLAQAVEIVRAVAGALHYAHERGIVHRDIKPENILLQSGQPLVADFGIALAVSQAAGERLTETGLAVGTPDYMSPEQATGERDLDRRSDIYSLGCVLYEMLTGRPPHQAPTAHASLARMLAGPPDSPTRFRRAIPANVEAAVMQALEAVPADRFASAQDFAHALSDPDFRRAGGEAADRSVPARWRRLGIAGWAAALAAAVAAVILGTARRDAPAPLIRFSIPPTAQAAFGEFDADPYPAVSPDGSSIAFVASTPEARNQLFVRPVGAAEPVRVERAVNAQWPFWSPDGRHLGYFADGRIRRSPVSGGPPSEVAAAVAFGGTWNARDEILFGTDRGIMRVAAGGGTPQRVTAVDSSAGDFSHRFPSFLPDGRRFVFVAIGTTSERSGVFVGSLDGGEPRQILTDVGNAAATEAGILVFARGGSLMAQRFDADWANPVGEPVRIATGLTGLRGTIRYAPLSAAAGTLVYRETNRPVTHLAVVDRAGRQLSTLGTPGVYNSPAWSPDGLRVAISHLDRNSGGLNLWMIDVSRDAMTPLTNGPFFESHPVWSADSRRLLFSSSRGGRFAVYESLLSTGGDSLLLAVPAGRAVPHSWSRDQRSLYYTLEDGTGPEGDVWAYSLETGTSRALVQTESDESQGRVSPDGRSLAYASDASGRWEVYLRPLDRDGMSVRVSARGGTNPAWRADGTELFYLEVEDESQSGVAVNGWLMAVPIGRAAGATPGEPRRLFRARWPSYIINELWTFQPDAAGQRFVVNTVVSEAQSPLAVVLGWQALLER